MIGEVASIVGGSQDVKAREKAMTCLDRAADRLNMAGTFIYRVKEKTYPVADLTDGQETLDLPDDWGWPLDPAHAFDSNSDIIRRLEWKPWDLFRALFVDNDQESIPKYLSIRSELDGSLHVWPKIKTADIGSLRVTYLARVQRVSEVEEIAILPETREALITGGHYLYAQYRYLKYPNIWEPLRREFDRCIDGAKAAANRRLQAMHMTIRPELEGNLPFGKGFEVFNPGTVYIRLSRN